MTQFEARYEAGTLSASQNALRVLKPTVLAVAMGCVGSAWAADGGVVVNGTGRIATQGTTTTVTQSTDKMVVNWNNFDIAQGQTVNFAQPSASSAVLNRVVGPVKATDIQGTLNANGRVYVVNPAGVMFGQNAVVNADSVVASTLNVDANQFMAGGRIAGNQKVLDLSAASTKGSVVNEGRINARQVALLGGQVLNRGQINATGDVTLGSAKTATLSLDNSGFSVAIGAPELNALVDNGGLIVAKGGNVLHHQRHDVQRRGFGADRGRSLGRVEVLPCQLDHGRFHGRRRRVRGYRSRLHHSGGRRQQHRPGPRSVGHCQRHYQRRRHRHGRQVRCDRCHRVRS